jgi:TM2 domain
MKKNLIHIFVAIFSFSFVLNTNATVRQDEVIPTENVLSKTTPSNLDSKLNDFLSLTPSKYKELTGKRLGIMGSIKLKIAQKQLKKQLNKPAASGSKSQLVALLLAVFVGVIGIHRFYLGYTTIGIIQIFTLGGCGIWALIDLIMIITGSLKPKDGSDYDPTL